MLHGSETFFLREIEIGILQITERSMMVRGMCGVQLKVSKRSMDLMSMLGLKETMHQLAMANCSLVCSCVEEIGWSRLKKGIRF